MEPTQSKPVPVRQCLRRLSVAAMQQELRLIAEHEPERKRRRWKHHGAMEHAADFPGNIPLPPDIGRDRVHRAAYPRILERQPVEANDVVDVNPGKPLPAVAQRTAEKESKWQGQQAKGERLAAEHHRGADSGDADTERFRLLCLVFPLLAEPGEKGIAGMALLRDDLLAAVPVVVDARGSDEHRWPTIVGRPPERLHQGGRRGQPAREEFRHPLPRPWPAADTGTGEVDNTLRSREFPHPVAVRAARVPGNVANTLRWLLHYQVPAENDHVMAVAGQALHQVAADKARSTTDQDFHPLSMLDAASCDRDRAGA